MVLAQLLLTFCALLFQTARAYTTFSMIVRANQTICFHEFYPEKESIAIHFKVEDIPSDRLQPKTQEVLAQAPLQTFIGHHIFNSKGEQIGAILAEHSDTFTYTTVFKEMLNICATNRFVMDVIITYNITVNVLNNDHERVPDKNHLKLYEAELQKIESMTEQMIGENNFVLMRTRTREITSSLIMESTVKFTGYAIAFILAVRGLQVWYLKSKLRSKKLL